MPTDKQLARIEVFNSLAVTAPQIELDRLLQRDLKAEESMALLNFIFSYKP